MSEEVASSPPPPPPHPPPPHVARHTCSTRPPTSGPHHIPTPLCEQVANAGKRWRSRASAVLGGIRSVVAFVTPGRKRKLTKEAVPTDEERELDPTELRRLLRIRPAKRADLGLTSVAELTEAILNKEALSGGEVDEEVEAAKMWVPLKRPLSAKTSQYGFDGRRLPELLISIQVREHSHTRNAHARAGGRGRGRACARAHTDERPSPPRWFLLRISSSCRRATDALSPTPTRSYPSQLDGCSYGTTRSPSCISC